MLGDFVVFGLDCVDLIMFVWLVVYRLEVFCFVIYFDEWVFAYLF